MLRSRLCGGGGLRDEALDLVRVGARVRVRARARARAVAGVHLPLARRRESEHRGLGVLAQDEGEPALQLVRDLVRVGG